jgi:hypothetical protein
VIWIAALPTQASQRSVASTINPNAASTANSGSASRVNVLRDRGGGCAAGVLVAVAAAAAEAVDPAWVAVGAGLI